MRLDEFITNMYTKVVGIDKLPPEREDGGTFQEWLREFKANYQPGLIVMHYNSIREEWTKGLGSEGFILTDGEHVIDNLVTKMN